MISSKLLLFFCFYLLLLLDNSLGHKPLVEQGRNKELLEDAIEFGETYGGVLEQLGSQWKQLLFQLVQAKRNVGLGKVQLARFNDSATTEEVGLAITDTYADKVAELVAIRTQDIGTTQKYIDDLQILKNEIALTMIVEMEKTKEQFKEPNVRKKIKEAKENGITDTDIKELLFAEFIDSRGGLSLIDAAAPTANALLSSFREGLQIILGGTYLKKLGILQYGNILGSLPFGNGGAAGGDNDAEEEYFDTEDGGDHLGGGVGGDDAPGGGDPPGGGNDPPGGGDDPSEGGNDPPGEEGDEYDIEEDDEDDDDPEYINIFAEFQQEFELTAEDLDRQLFPRTDKGTDGETGNHVQGFSQFNEEQANEAHQAVDYYMESLFDKGQDLEDQLRKLEDDSERAMVEDPSLQVPLDRRINNTERVAILQRRLAVLEMYLERLDFLYTNYVDLRLQILQQLDIARQNVIYYGDIIGGNLSNIDPSLVPNSTPPELLEFNRIPISNAMRYLVSGARMNTLINFRTDRIDGFESFNIFRKIIYSRYRRILALIDEVQNLPPI